MFCALGTLDGEHTIAFHTNTEAKSWDLLFKIVEAELGRSDTPGWITRDLGEPS
ncbi:hypothetical protein AB0B45_20835 [Nonomuraea sp. NPDC049152]|uniref:hypothetical protein n=1 Tax=Nonomuraea sp. NPDC049152 TaxID=3154350 RepID=UPI0033FFB1A5